MSGPENPTGGVKAFSIAGRVANLRERHTRMTEDERRWRAQWLKDQVLSAEEPKYVPEYYKATNNIFRRIWQGCARQFETVLTPFLGRERAELTRRGASTVMKFTASIYILAYIVKYHSNEFTRSRSIEIWCPRAMTYPDEPDFPNFPKRTKEDFYDLGFYSSVLCVDAVPPPPPPPPEIEMEEACVVTDSTS